MTMDPFSQAVEKELLRQFPDWGPFARPEATEGGNEYLVVEVPPFVLERGTWTRIGNSLSMTLLKSTDASRLHPGFNELMQVDTVTRDTLVLSYAGDNHSAWQYKRVPSVRGERLCTMAQPPGT
jgi:hypothetical protein